MEMRLNTIRTIDHDQTKELIESDIGSIWEKVAIAMINPEDLEKLQVIPNSNIKVNSKHGSVILKALKNKNVPTKMICVPVSIWANQLTGIKGKELFLKNLDVNVEPTKESILTFAQLIEKIKNT
ncbi:MAG: hypothetical protein JW891_16575 [Candidatus Lokiarchaeota archaeon]|nr:hypothetical protein [Candidatus Lokiarchaeota archaeon]